MIRSWVLSGSTGLDVHIVTCTQLARGLRFDTKSYRRRILPLTLRQITRAAAGRSPDLLIRARSMTDSRFGDRSRF